MSVESMLRAGIIGLGRIAWSYDAGQWSGERSVSHAACLERHPDTHLVAVYDPVSEARSAFTNGFAGIASVSVCQTLEAFFAQDLDIVIIASPSEYHVEHGLCCLDQGVPRILFEKPVALSSRGFLDLSSRYRSIRPRPLTSVNYFRRFLPQVASLKDFVREARDKEELVRIDITYSRGLIVNGSHMLDLLGHIFDLTECPPLGYIQLHDNETSSFGMEIEQCPVAVLGASGLDYHGLSLRVVSKRGHMSLTRNGQDLLYSKSVPNPDFPGFSHLDPAEPFLPLSMTRKAMLDGTYLSLCDLVSGTQLSPLDQSGFVQSVLARVAAFGLAEDMQ